MARKYTQIRDLDLEEFKSYYYDHSNKETINYFNLSSDSFYKLLSQNKFPHLRQGKISQAEKSLDKEKVLNYYKNHTLEDTAKYFSVSPFILDNIFIKWEINKHSINKNRELGCLKKYGVNYYSETKEFKAKTKATWSSKSKEEKIKRRNKISKAFSQMPKEKVEDRLRKISKSPNHIKSLPNQEFKIYLISKGFKDIEEEFVLGRYLYDFKVGNWLIEINPFATHNSTWGYRNGDPKSKTYHYDKSKLAIDNGYNCICVWDWSDKEEIIKNLKNNNQRIQKNIKCHLYNYKTKEHQIISQPPDILNKEEVIIYDDGQD